jgi:hypothetical protein
VVVVHEVEWERQKASGLLIFEVEGGHPAKRREKRIRGQCARRQMDKSLDKFEGFRAFFDIESQDEHVVRLRQRIPPWSV